jgi:tetratricopeptide (TPR) repeat protein
MPVPRIGSPLHPRRVLLIGWDAADWRFIDPLIEQGLMPTTAALRARGASGPLASTQPMLSPILWNSIATGHRPDRHGICGFTEPDPQGRGVRPVASTSRRCKAIWNILTQSGLRSHTVGWYASHPAEPIAGTMVSDRLEFLAGEGPLAPLRPGCVHPTERTEELSHCRVHPSELDASAILPFVPDAAALAQRPGHRLGRLAGLIAQSATIHSIATRLISQDDWEFAAVYFEGIDRFGHEFMEFHPPRMPQVDPAEFEAYRHCMVGIHRFHDMMLETLLAIAGEGTAVVLLSDHGYESGDRRPDPTSAAVGPVDWHRPHGIFLAAGPGIRAGARLYGGTILDLAPTLLAMLGLPAGSDMPGRVLAEVLDGLEAPPRIGSWDEVPGDSGMHPPDLRIDAAESREALRQLVELGYIEAPSGDEDAAAREAASANSLHLAISQADAGRHAEAIATIESLDDKARGSLPTRTLLASCLLGAGRLGDAEAVLASIPEGDPKAESLRANLEVSRGDAEAALRRLVRLRDASVGGERLSNRIGSILASLGRHEEAEAAFQAALREEPQDPAALAGAGRARLALGDPEAALGLLLHSASLAFHAPATHLAIGRAHLALGDPAAAIEAIEASLRQAPGWPAASSLLAEVRAAALPADSRPDRGASPPEGAPS